MEDKPGALEHCARMNNQCMTMRDIHGVDGTRHCDVVCFPTLEWERHIRDTGADAREVADDEEDQHGTPGRRCVSMSTQSLL